MNNTYSFVLKLADNDFRVIPLARLNELLDTDFHSPNSFELIQMKSALSKALDLELDNVIVHMNGSALL